MKFTSVASFHTNVYGCGVAKFSAELAKRLGVPFCPIYGDVGAFPLLSLKWSELAGEDESAPFFYLDSKQPYGLFLHDAGVPQEVIDGASVVFYADPSLGSPGLWCPSLLTPSKPRTVRLFSFGMAHKLQTAHYAKVRQLLEAAGLDYRLRVSVGLHEGTSLDDATKHFDALREIMGADKVTILGCLSDDAVAEELSNAEFVLAFFEKGLRANNTTVHAALEHGCRVISNPDLETPSPLIYDVIDLEFTERWPSVSLGYSWERLISKMETLCEASASASV